MMLSVEKVAKNLLPKMKQDQLKDFILVFIPNRSFIVLFDLFFLFIYCLLFSLLFLLFFSPFLILNFLIIFNFLLLIFLSNLKQKRWKKMKIRVNRLRVKPN